MEHHAHARELDEDDDVADEYQANGTPNFFIDGRHLVGAQPEERFDALIDEEIAKADALVAHGTKPAAIYAELTKDGKSPPPPDTRELPPSLPPGDPARGSLAAKVTVHEFADFQCPFCKRVEPTLQKLMQNYGGRIRLVWHDLPLPMHPDAELAAEAAREAYAQRHATGFWSMHDQLFDHQKALARPDLDEYAHAAGLDMDVWSAALDSAAHAQEVGVDKDAASAVGIAGTPSFLITVGEKRTAYFINGAQAYSKFRRVIERALSEAR
jgi:protein-disulfide isomerase